MNLSTLLRELKPTLEVSIGDSSFIQIGLSTLYNLHIYREFRRDTVQLKQTLTGETTDIILDTNFLGTKYVKLDSREIYSNVFNSKFYSMNSNVMTVTGQGELKLEYRINPAKGLVRSQIQSEFATTGDIADSAANTTWMLNEFEPMVRDFIESEVYFEQGHTEQSQTIKARATNIYDRIVYDN